MRFDARELQSYAEPVVAAELRAGAIYSAVQFIDDELLIPELEALVFVGQDLMPDDRGILYFQGVGSYREAFGWSPPRPTKQCCAH